KGRDIGNTFVILYTRKSNNSNSVPRKVPKPEWLDKQMFPDDERVFKEWNEYPKFLDRKVRQLKQLPWGYHSLRHRRASLWSKEGKPIFEIMSLLGHSTIETTQIYLQLLPD
ncbi:MAG: tyrosine-type recombinase/integrase, partial [Ignavibacteria bacterium]|nr:tyrosine-type recombinase/integrase [Ignavibacteria bacterium]